MKDVVVKEAFAISGNDMLNERTIDIERITGVAVKVAQMMLTELSGPTEAGACAIGALKIVESVCLARGMPRELFSAAIKGAGAIADDIQPMVINDTDAPKS